MITEGLNGLRLELSYLVMDSEWDNDCSRPLKPHLEDTDLSRSNIDSSPCLDSENNISQSSLSDGSSKNSEAIIPAFDIFDPEENLRAFPHSASSSSGTSSDNLLQVIPTAIVKPHKDVFVSSDGSAKLDETGYGSSGPPSNSMVSEITDESTVHNLSPIQSPPVQVMDRSGGYKPYRIPSSVFARSKNSTPVEWSIASNDSLFSIQIGNSSFSRDHFVMCSSDVPKSGALLESSQPIPFSSQPAAQMVVVMPDDDLSADVEEISKANKKSVGLVQENNDCQIKGKTANNTVGPINSSRHSDESGTSAVSFSFPILTEVDRSDPIKIDAEKFRQQLQYQEQCVQQPPCTPTSRSSSKRACSSCGSCWTSCNCYRSCCPRRSCCSRWSSCSWWSCRPCCSKGSCWSCFSCSSCRSCSSCCGCYSSFSCRIWPCQCCCC